MKSGFFRTKMTMANTHWQRRISSQTRTIPRSKNKEKLLQISRALRPNIRKSTLPDVGWLLFSCSPQMTLYAFVGGTNGLFYQPFSVKNEGMSLSWFFFVPWGQWHGGATPPAVFKAIWISSAHYPQIFWSQIWRPEYFGLSRDYNKSCSPFDGIWSVSCLTKNA